jgi:hypothetical protein
MNANIKMTEGERDLYNIFVKYSASLIKKYGPDLIKKKKKKPKK